MTSIQEALSVDFVAWILTGLILIFGMVAIADIIGKFSVIIGKPVKWVKKKNEDHEKIQELVKSQKVTDEQITTMSKKVDKISSIVLDSQIEKMRWDILDFASSLASNRIYSREQFSYVFKVYDKYEKILEENDMTNGEVEESMAIIREKYRDFLNK